MTIKPIMPIMPSGTHIFCKPCREHSMFCPCWQHGRFGVDCGVIGFPHIHDFVDISFISTAEERPVLIRRKSDLEFDAVQYTGDLNSLIVWLSSKNDFVSMTIDKNLSITIITQGGQTFTITSGDWLRITGDSLLDKISATNFIASWEQT